MIRRTTRCGPKDIRVEGRRRSSRSLQPHLTEMARGQHALLRTRVWCGWSRALLGSRDDALGEIPLVGEGVLGEVEIGIDDLGASWELPGEIGEFRDLGTVLRNQAAARLRPGGDDWRVVCLAATADAPAHWANSPSAVEDVGRLRLGYLGVAADTPRP